VKNKILGTILFITLNIIVLGLFIASTIFSLLFYIGDLLPKDMNKLDISITNLSLLIGLGLLALLIEFTKIILSYYRAYIHKKSYRAGKSTDKLLNVSLFLSITASLAFFQKYAGNFSPSKGIIEMLFEYIPLHGRFINWTQSIIILVVNFMFSGLIEVLIIKLPWISIIGFTKEEKEIYKSYGLLGQIKDKAIYIINKKLSNILYIPKIDPEIKQPKVNLIKSQKQIEPKKLKVLSSRIQYQPNKAIETSNINNLFNVIKQNSKSNISPSVDRLVRITGLSQKEIREIRKELINNGKLKVNGNKTMINHVNVKERKDVKNEE
jgi:hypothetical protein